MNDGRQKTNQALDQWALRLRTNHPRTIYADYLVARPTKHWTNGPCGLGPSTLGLHRLGSFLRREINCSGTSSLIWRINSSSCWREFGDMASCWLLLGWTGVFFFLSAISWRQILFASSIAAFFFSAASLASCWFSAKKRASTSLRSAIWASRFSFLLASCPAAWTALLIGLLRLRGSFVQ